jgi:hypothetical protein
MKRPAGLQTFILAAASHIRFNQKLAPIPSRSLRKTPKKTRGGLILLLRDLVIRITCAFLISCVVYAEEAGVHLVKREETFSQIAEKYLGRPIYKTNGSLARLRKLNPQVTDPDHIYPGQEIFIEMGTREVASAPEVPVVPPVSEEQAPPPHVPTAPVVPVAPMAPAAPTVLTTPTTSAQSDVILSLGTGYSRIDSTMNSSNAVLLSRPSKTVGARWEQHWTQIWHSHLRWSASTISFNETAQAQALTGGSQTLTQTAFGVRARMAPGLWSTLELGMREDIFAPSYSPGTANLETRAIPTMRLLLSKDLVEVQSLKLIGVLGVGYLSGVSAGDYDVKPGHEFVGQIQVVQKLKNFSIFTSGDYGQTRQDTSITKQKRTDIGLQLGISFPLGETTP